ncbi:MAG: hypothetical protein Fur0025_35590 [Oscillatoriaceae cyanobacterium]
MAKSPVCIITGMHRSGTSLVASFLQALGVNLGSQLIPPDGFNVKGYFEDAEFLQLQRTILHDACAQNQPGWHDWGWTINEGWDKSKLAGWVPAAQELLAARQNQGIPWGWKDPRTCLLLDFWRELLGNEARFLLVYRFPWDVADSILRLNSDVFSQHRDWPLKIWYFYNQQMLDFYRRYAPDCILVNVNAFVKHQDKLLEIIESKWQWQLLAGEQRQMLTKGIFEQRFFRSLDAGHPLVRLLAKWAPQYVDLLGQLDAMADLSSGFVPAGDECAPEGLLWQLYGETLTINRDIQPKFIAVEDNFGRETGGQQLDPGGEIRVSVIIPCYNQGEFILDAIASVEDCWDDVWELIVVDDGSIEALTKDVLEYLKSCGYRVISQTNQGLAKARNVGIEMARGRYILPLDADNKIKPDYIRKGIEILDKYPQVGVVYGNGEFFGERQGVWEVPDFDLERLLRGNYIDACAVFRKQVWADCGGYDGEIPEQLGFEDWDLWLGAAAKGWQFYRIPEVMFSYRVRSGSMVSTCRIPAKRFLLVSYICAKHRDLYMADNRFARTIAHLMAQ